MIKKVIFQNSKGQKDYVLAKEMTVKLLFNNNYTFYLKERLKDNRIKLIKVEKYDNGLKPFESEMKRIENPFAIDEDVKRMYDEERHMTIKKGVQTLNKFTQKKHLKTQKRGE